MTRRNLIAVGTVALGSAALAQSVSMEPPNPFDDAAFMQLSHRLIAHRLNVGVGRRLADALDASHPPMSDDIAALVALARLHKAQAVEDFIDFATEAQRQTAQKIISAWYLGIVNDAPGGEVIAYELALMFAPVSDVTTIPTYAIGAPNSWTSQAPPLAAMPFF